MPRPSGLMLAVTVGLLAASASSPQSSTVPAPSETGQTQTAQTTAPVSPPSQSIQPPPAIRVTTRLVQVSVVVHDGHGNPITDLTKDDFVVLDEKQPQEIRIFSMETNELPPHPPPPLPPNTYTNRIQEQGNVPTSITVILFDGLNTEVSDQAYAKKQVVKFIETQVHPQDRVAIYSLGSDLRILHDFTNDSSSLLAALADYRGRYTPLPQASVPQLSDNPNANIAAFLDNAYEHEANFYMRNRVHQTVEALTDIANHVGTLPGRKNLIWVSAAFPFSLGFDPADTRGFDTQELYADEVETAARALTNANVAVYPVDARGLMTADMGTTAQSVSGGHLRGSAMAHESQFSGPSTENFDTMNSLAEDTGGKAFYNRNDIWGAIRDAIDDSRVTYELGYYPQGVEWNGKFRSIKVEVKRSGAHVRARKGYYAMPEPKLTPQLRQAIIALAAKSPLEPTGIGINVSVEKEAGADRKLRAVAGFDLHDFAMELKDGRWQGAVDTVFLQIDNTGGIVDALDQTFQLHLDPNLYQRLLQQGVTTSKELAIRPNAIELRVMVRDAATGTIGGVSVPLAKYFPVATSSVN